MQEIIKDIKTPFYLYDFDVIKERFLSIKNSLNGVSSNIFYAVKANSNLSLLKFLKELDSGFDCVSVNEIKRALLIGAKPYKIIFSGVAKSKEDLEFALQEKILYINIENQAELDLLEECAKNLNTVANISIRVNPNVDAKTHPYISTGLKENKFGVSLDIARKMYLKAHKSEYLNPIACHFHIGSNLLDLSPIIQSAKIIKDFVTSLNSAGLNIRFFDIGGGIGVSYLKDEIEPNIKDFFNQIKAIAKDYTICTEPGRYIVANAGYLVTKVLYEKINENKRFVIVDAAMSELIRPSLYNAKHEIICFKDDLANSSKADVVGGVCESGDFLAKDVVLPSLNSQDYLIVKSAGAYGYVMSSNYNSRTKIAEYAIINGKIKLINKAEDFMQMIKGEVECL